jgi:hypothetical protein
VKAPGWGCSIHKVSLCATTDYLLAKRVMMMMMMMQQGCQLEADCVGVCVFGGGMVARRHVPSKQGWHCLARTECDSLQSVTGPARQEQKLLLHNGQQSKSKGFSVRLSTLCHSLCVWQRYALSPLTDYPAAIGCKSEGK